MFQDVIKNQIYIQIIDKFKISAYYFLKELDKYYDYDMI